MAFFGRSFFPSLVILLSVSFTTKYTNIFNLHCISKQATKQHGGSSRTADPDCSSASLPCEQQREGNPQASSRKPSRSRTWFWQKKSASITSHHDAQPPKQQKDKSKRLVVRKKKEKKKRRDSSGESPLVYLLAILESRGYSIAEFPALETAYHCTPTPIQEASYGGHLIDVVRRGEGTQLRSLMASGLSPNACNQHGESLVHMACRRGEAECLGVLIEYGATLQIADDYVSTPLHWLLQVVLYVFEPSLLTSVFPI
jgi:ankyrin repeat protein